MKLRRLFCGLAAAAFLAAAPVGAESGDSVDVKVTEFDLPNGLHVILSEDHSVPMVATNIMYKVGSGDETDGRTGFAHLFEHLMFSGSGHLDKGQFDKMLENIGGTSNAFTMEDYTDYYIRVPSNALPLALYLESDRLGYFLDGLRQNIVDDQRDVVKNEMRERYLNDPYGQKNLALPSLLYPAGHPYSWPIIGSMDDLTAAQYADVVNFFKEHYSPGNASLAIVGDFDTAEAKKLVEYWFSDVSPRQTVKRTELKDPVRLNGVVRKTFTDNRAKFPYRELVWHSPAQYQEGDAACQVLAYILADPWGAVYARLVKRLTYEQKIANSISAYQDSRRLGSHFHIAFSAYPGHTLDEIQNIVDEEIARIAEEPPAQKEIDRVVNGIELSFCRQNQSYNSLATALNFYYCGTGEANYFNRDLERYRSVTPQEVSDCAKRWLQSSRRVEISILPERKDAKAADAVQENAGEVKP